MCLYNFSSLIAVLFLERGVKRETFLFKINDSQ